MRTYVLRPSALFFLTFMFALLLGASACQTGTNTNTNTNTANLNSTPATTNANVTSDAATTINAREPDKYRATLVFTAQTEGGEKTIGIPTLSAEVARSGDDRRVSFKLPDGSDLIYIDHENKHYVIVPSRKQYAELTPEATGVQIQKLMTPGQIVGWIEKRKGIERVGEEEVDGRRADKYRYATTTNTNTQAGQVSTQAFVFVDKETGLPLRSELVAETSGDVKGVKGARFLAELRDISTTVDPSMFEVPAGLNKVTAEQVRQQIDALTSTASAVVKALLSSMQATTPAAAASPSPAASTSPKPSN